MTQYAIGDSVRVLPPFDATFSREYLIEGIDETGCAVFAGSSFDDAYLQLVHAGTGAPPATAAPRYITPLAFRERFLPAERVSIELAALDSPSGDMQARAASAALRAQLADVMVAQRINLAGERCREGVQMLEAAGVIGPGRALAILDEPVSPDEAA